MLRILALVICLSSIAAADEGTDFFEAKIRPVLVEHCYACHSADAARAKKLKGELLLDTRDGIRKGGESGPAVVPGKVKESVLIAAIQHDSFKMPPKGKLPEQVIADFVKWIELGAPDPREENNPTATPYVDIENGRRFWAFQPPQVHERPRVQDDSWPQKELDWFILTGHEQRGLKRVRPATKTEWIRRATFDLIGLPPTPEEIAAFEKDSSPQAHAKVLDRLLDSRHYGERWGRHWLDLARYTDDLGGTVNPVAAPNAYRYRDWVIQAFNEDMPIDQFIRLQLAGDLLPQEGADHFVRLAGLGFQGLGQKFSGNAVGMVKKKMADELDDRVDTVSRVLQGLTVSCARCHNHKFDPIPTSDYYAFASAYNGAEWNVELPLMSAAELEHYRQREKQAADRNAELTKRMQAERDALIKVEAARLSDYLLAGWKVRVLLRQNGPIREAEVAKQLGLQPYFLARWLKVLAADQPLPELEQLVAASKSSPVPEVGLPEPSADLIMLAKQLERALNKALQSKDPSSEEKKLLKTYVQNEQAAFKVADNDLIGMLGETARKSLEQLREEVARLRKEVPPAPARVVGVKNGGQPMRINIRGNPEQLGEVAPPGFLRVLSWSHEENRETRKFTRLDLAEAIVDRGNPLTTRVFVNRVWHHHFGRGIVGTTGNFGHLGDRPTHPELLDTLAMRFMEAGWSTKWLHREIMLSATYQLASAPHSENANKDGDNIYLWRTSPRRLDFEVWRDAMLAVAGKLDPSIGGPSVVSPDDPTHYRRTVYSFISRFKPSPTLTLFDFPEPNVTSDRRIATTIPQQQLFALNSPFILAMSKAMAARITGALQDDRERIRLAWRLAYGRDPGDREIKLSLQLLQDVAANEQQLSPWEQLCHSLLMSNEFAFVN